jgi:amidophosphoribosyltransferase
LIKNKYIGRTFISPRQNERLDKVRIKLSPVKNVIDGKRVVLIDDSIVRGTTSRQIVKLLRDAGAREIHMRISAPPFLHPCYYGTDIDSEENLIACHHSTEEIAGMLGVNSLGYLEISQLGKLIESEDYCAACFNGRYPTRIPIDLRKDRFERKLSERKK